LGFASHLVGIRCGGYPLAGGEVVNSPNTQFREPVPGPLAEVDAFRLREHLREVSARAGESADAFLAEVTMVINQHVPGTEHAGITLAEYRNKIRSHSATGFCPLVLDGIQQRCKCGPSIDLADDQLSCRIDDFSVEVRWPAFVGPVLACSPIRSMLSFRIYCCGGITAALNLYASQPHAFPMETNRVVEVLATETRRAVKSKNCDNNMTSTAGDDPVEQAARILMNRYDIDKIAAYSLLVRLAKGSRHTVAAVASRLIQPPRR
jgi:ANTAR domain